MLTCLEDLRWNSCSGAKHHYSHWVVFQSLHNLFLMGPWSLFSPLTPPFSLSYLHFYISFGLLCPFSDTTTWFQLCILGVCPCSEVKTTENVVPSWEVGGWSLQSCSTGVDLGLLEFLEWSVNKANKWGVEKGKEENDERVYSLVKLSHNECIKG